MTIFIKSCKKDLRWLQHCLKAVHLFFEDPDVVLVLDENCRATVEGTWGLGKERVHYVPDHPNGYLQQQVVKLRAHHYTDAPVIMFLDSDTMVRYPCGLETFLHEDGRPVIVKTAYAKLPNLPWQRATENAVGFPVEYEYMRQVPLVYDRRTLEEAERLYPDLQERLLGMLKHNFGVFSEFNFLGAVAAKFHPELYHWVDTELAEPIDSNKYFRVFWSKTGLTPAERAEIDRLLEPVAKVDPYATHLPVLSAYLRNLPGVPLEVGTGYYSTPLIQAFGGESVELDPIWYSQMRRLYPGVVLADDWAPRDWYSFVFLDSAPLESRIEYLRRLRNKANVFVIHDEQRAVRHLAKEFAFSHVYAGQFPHTLVLSDVDISGLRIGG